MSREIMEALFTFALLSLPLAVVVGTVALLVKGAVGVWRRNDSARPAIPARAMRDADATI